MQRLQIFQSMWAMETPGVGFDLERNLERIAAAGFDGFTDHYYRRDHVQRLAQTFTGLGLQVEAQTFPRTIDELQPTLELCAEFGCHHVTIQPDLRPKDVGEAVAVLEGWQRLAEQVDFPVLVETHRYRLTNDLHFTLEVLDQLPDLKLLGDLSHYVVARELPARPSAEDQADIRRILDHSWGFHGRVASGEQVQVPLSFPHHRDWVALFRDWWKTGFASWRRRAGEEATLPFTCELGPPPYAITDAQGRDVSDRWQESLTMKRLAETLWQEVMADVPREPADA